MKSLPLVVVVCCMVCMFMVTSKAFLSIEQQKPQVVPAPPPPVPVVQSVYPTQPANPQPPIHPIFNFPTSHTDGQRPELLKPVLRWLGLDAGRDFFNHLVSWNKKARAEHALILEVGAGDGRQAVRAAVLGYRVISCDASKSNIESGKTFMAQANSTSGGNVTWVWTAVSDYKGTASFWAQAGMGRLLDAKESNSVTHKDNPKWRGQSIDVAVNRLDDIIPTETPYILKIDVEGHELSVLRGAPKLLARKIPIIILEFNPAMMEWSAHHDAYEVLKLLHDLGYDLYDSQISEPAKKGFVAKYGSFHRPTGYREMVDWLKKSAEFDWWGSWTDIVAILPS